MAPRKHEIRILNKQELAAEPMSVARNCVRHHAPFKDLARLGTLGTTRAKSQKSMRGIP
jgi:hypothetical protein